MCAHIDRPTTNLTRVSGSTSLFLWLQITTAPFQVPVSCNIINGDMPGIEYHLRSIRIACSIIAILIYIPILIKIYNVSQIVVNLFIGYFQLILKKTQSKLTYAELMKLVRSTFTIGLLAANELLFFVFPDVYLYLNSKTPITYVLYVIILNKGNLHSKMGQ